MIPINSEKKIPITQFGSRAPYAGAEYIFVIASKSDVGRLFFIKVGANSLLGTTLLSISTALALSRTVFSTRSTASVGT